MLRFISIVLISLVGVCNTWAQTNVDEHDASDPATMKSRITTDFDSYFFVAEARHYAMRLGYDY